MRILKERERSEQFIGIFLSLFRPYLEGIFLSDHLIEAEGTAVVLISDVDNRAEICRGGCTAVDMVIQMGMCVCVSGVSNLYGAMTATTATTTAATTTATTATATTTTTAATTVRLCAA